MYLGTIITNNIYLTNRPYYINTPNNMPVKQLKRDLKEKYYLSVKATMNGCVFRTDSKISRHRHRHLR